MQQNILSWKVHWMHFERVIFYSILLDTFVPDFQAIVIFKIVCFN